MERLCIAAGHALEVAVTEHGQNVIDEVSSIFDRGAWLQINVDEVADEAIGELADCRSP